MPVQMHNCMHRHMMWYDLVQVTVLTGKLPVPVEKDLQIEMSWTLIDLVRTQSLQLCSITHHYQHRYGMCS